MRGRILVVDDDDVVLKSCARVLEPEGYEVVARPSAKEGLRALDEGAFDLIFVDIKMPEMDGLTFMRCVRENDKDINMVVITGDPSQDMLREALGLRIIDSLPKPFSPATLLDVAAKGIEIRHRPEPLPGPEEETGREEEFTPAMLGELDEIVRRYKGKPGSLIPVLQDAQEHFGYLPALVQRRIARGLRIPPSEVHAVVSFYSFFSMKPKGKHNIRVCLGTACYVKGAEDILNNYRNGLRVSVGGMTEDQKYSLESVRCLGACGLAPVVVVDKDTHGPVNPVNALDLLKQYS